MGTNTDPFSLPGPSTALDHPMTSPAQKEVVLQALKDGVITLQGQFINSSNFTLLALCTHAGQQLRVVYKPLRGERPLWDFPPATLARRETAAFIVSEALGWDLVPPTVFRRRKAPAGPGSLQLFVEHDPAYHYFNFSPADRQGLRPVVLFDLLINNADRKGGHILVDPRDHIWLIDHGVCFHIEYKLRTVIWDFSGEPVPAPLQLDLARLSNDLLPQGALALKLKGLLKVAEIKALQVRASLLAELPGFPSPDAVRRPFPWPPV